MLHVRFVPGNECSLERIVLRTNVPDTYCLTYRLTRDLLTVTNLLVIYRASVGASTQSAILFYHVCLSVCPSCYGIVYKRMQISSNCFNHLVVSLRVPLPPLYNFNNKPTRVCIRCTGCVKNVANLDRNRLLLRKQYETTVYYGSP